MTPDEPAPRPPSSRVGSSGPGWVPPSVEELQALLPQYEILSMLGHGGMGAVYKGKQKSLDRLVAIKILPPGLDDDEVKFAERFKNEARTMARMNHPGIVSVYDFGETSEGQLYFIMEYVDGTDVAQMIKGSGRLPPDHALAITAHVCDALAYAHGHGVVHRDIKPANILINMQGQVKVADFGLAKQSDASQTTGLTKTGMAMGTPDYVAPEALIMGVNVDGRADIYAVGVMLYQMLTGDIPRGMFLMPSIRNKGATDPRFDAIIARAMQTEREMRYQTAAELRRDLDVILTTPRVKQDASKAVAAVPEQAVKNVPDKRSAAVKPVMRGPGAPAGQGKPPEKAAAKPVSHSAAANPKSKSSLPAILGIAATLIVAGGLVFMLGGTRSGDTPIAGSGATDGGKSAAAPSAPIKVTEPPKAASPPSPTPLPPGGLPLPEITGWQDAMAAVKEQRNSKGSNRLKVENGWLVATPDSGAAQMRTQPLAGTAVRGRLRGTCDVLLRTSLKGHYTITFEEDGTGGIGHHSMEPSSTTWLTHFTMSKSPEHDFLITMTGPDIRVWVDGAFAATARDTRFEKGGVSVGALKASWAVRDLAVAELPADWKPASSPAPAVASGLPLPAITGWEDVMKAVKDYRDSKGASPFTEEKGWFVAARDSGYFVVSATKLAGTAVRGRLRGRADVTIRAGSSAGSTRGHYNVSFYENGTGNIGQHRFDTGQTTFLARFTMSQGPEHEFLVTMMGPDIRVWVDGTLAATARDTMFETGGVSIAVPKAGAALRDLAIAGLPADWKPAAPVAAGAPKLQASSEQWVDVLREYFALPVEKRDASVTFIEPSPEGWKVSERRAFNLMLGDKRNVALRATVRGIKEPLVLALRNMGGAAQRNLRNYQATLKPDGSVMIRRKDESQPTVVGELSHSAPVPGFAPDARHTFEFRAVDDVLTATLDGRALESVRDALFTKGGLSFTGNAGMIVEKLELADLSAQPPASGSSASPAKESSSLPTITGWQDMMAAAKDAILKVGQTGVKEEDGWLVATSYKGMAGALLDYKSYGGVAMRGHVRGSVYMNLRISREPAGYYAARFLRNGTGNFTLVTHRPEWRETILTRFTLNAAPEHEFVFAITGPDLYLWVDGQLVATARDTTIVSGNPGIALAEEGAAFRDLAIAELPADFASKLAPIASSEEKWIDGLAEWFAANPQMPADLATEESEGLRMGKIASIKAWESRNRAGQGDLADVALRATVNGAAAGINLCLRTAGEKSRYSAGVGITGYGGITLDSEDGTRKSLKTFDLPAGFSSRDRHTVEFRAQGDTLVFLLDGTELARLRDGSRKTGGGYLLTSPGALIEKLEYRELPPVAEAAKASAGTQTLPTAVTPLQPGSRPPAAADPVSLKLADLEKTFLAAYEQQAGAAHKAAVADLNAKFTAALDRAIATVSKAGKLDEALALRNERTQIQKSGAVPEEDAEGTSKTLTDLRATYRATMTTLIASRDKLAAPLYAAYDRALAAYQDELTRQQKLDEAARVKAVRDQIAAQRDSSAGPQSQQETKGAASASGKSAARN